MKIKTDLENTFNGGFRSLAITSAAAEKEREEKEETRVAYFGREKGKRLPGLERLRGLGRLHST